MHSILQADLQHFDDLLAYAQRAATAFLAGLPDRPAAARAATRPFRTLPEGGTGGPAALADFLRTYAAASPCQALAG